MMMSLGQGLLVKHVISVLKIILALVLLYHSLYEYAASTTGEACNMH